MANTRKRPNAQVRWDAHDYDSPALYCLRLRKGEGYPNFCTLRGLGNEVSTEVSKSGQVVREVARALERRYPQLSIPALSLLPDSALLAVRVDSTEPDGPLNGWENPEGRRQSGETEGLLERAVRDFRKGCQRLWLRRMAPREEGVAAEDDTAIRAYADRGSFAAIREGEEDNRMAHIAERTLLATEWMASVMPPEMPDEDLALYVEEAPARYLERARSGGWRRRFRIRFRSTSLEAFGNWQLLAEPLRTAVKFSSRYSPEELLAQKRRWHHTIINDGVIVSPFIHAQEKNVLNWAVSNGGCVIWLLPSLSAEDFRPNEQQSQALDEGRLLLVSVPLPEDEAEHVLRFGWPGRPGCEMLNALAADMACRIYEPLG